jgi:uncharacterized BrkB/YihY/UPF0761 family membrane protein
MALEPGHQRSIAMEPPKRRSGLVLALALATGINGLLALMVMRFAWALEHHQADLFDGLDIAMYVLAISVPISAVCLFGLLIAVVFRFAPHGALVPRYHTGAISLAGVNIVAPVLLWYFLKWAGS